MLTCYYPDLSTYHASCEINYARMMALLTKYALKPGQIVRCDMQDASCLTMTVLEHYRYTSIFQAEYQPSIQVTWFKPCLFKLSAQHDLRMLEVVANQNTRYLLGKYSYPNQLMLQPDEKYQTNIFFGELLKAVIGCT